MAGEFSMEEGLISAWNELDEKGRDRLIMRLSDAVEMAEHFDLSEALRFEEFKETSFLILPPNMLKPIRITTIDEGDETFDTKDKVHVITYRLKD